MDMGYRWSGKQPSEVGRNSLLMSQPRQTLTHLPTTDMASPIGTFLRQDPTDAARRQKGKEKQERFRLPPFSFDSRVSTAKAGIQAQPTDSDFTAVKPLPVVVALLPVLCKSCPCDTNPLRVLCFHKFLLPLLAGSHCVFLYPYNFHLR